MVAVGNDELLIGHRALDGRDAVRGSNKPEAVNDTVLVSQLGDGTLGGLDFLEDRVDPALRLGIKHEELAGVRARVPEKFEAVSLRPGQRVFVTENNAGGVLLELAKTNEASAYAAE
jgi:hypothetical protein